VRTTHSPTHKLEPCLAKRHPADRTTDFDCVSGFSLSAQVNLVEKWTGVPIQLVFISVDPERDTPPVVKEYTREFHPRMIGLTGEMFCLLPCAAAGGWSEWPANVSSAHAGEMDKVKAVSKAYRVYFSKTGDSDTDYLVDHSIIHYLISPTGEFVTFFGKNTDAQQLARQVRRGKGRCAHMHVL
jgi:protein SCO1/2